MFISVRCVAVSISCCVFGVPQVPKHDAARWCGRVSVCEVCSFTAGAICSRPWRREAERPTFSSVSLPHLVGVFSVGCRFGRNASGV